MIKELSKIQSPAENLRFLDGLRGLAALYVMIFHSRWLLWEGYGAFHFHQGDYSLLRKGLVYLSSLFRYGHEAVLFFFVLSGFVIHLRYARQIKKEGKEAGFGWGSFLWRRTRRIYPPLFAALALTFCLDAWGRSRGFPIYQGATPYPVINQNIGADHSWPTLLGNLAFLMQTYVPVFGSNGPLWSLKYEWWFYMFYPLFWWISRRTLAGATGLMLGLFFLARLGGVWPVALVQDVFGSMLIWWMGVLLADIYTARIAWPWAAVTVGAVALAILFLALPGNQGLPLALGFTGLIAGGFWLQERGVSLRFLEKLKPLGDMSFSLYVLHMPILVLLSGWVMSRSTDGTLPRHFGWAALGMMITVVVAYALHFVVELPFVSHGKVGRVAQ